MSSTDGVPTTRGPIDELPTFELDFGFDDPDDPEELTIFAPGERVTTRWISVDARHAVPIEAVA